VGSGRDFVDAKVVIISGKSKFFANFMSLFVKLCVVQSRLSCSIGIQSGWFHVAWAANYTLLYILTVAKQITGNCLASCGYVSGALFDEGQELGCVRKQTGQKTWNLCFFALSLHRHSETKPFDSKDNIIVKRFKK